MELSNRTIVTVITPGLYSKKKRGRRLFPWHSASVVNVRAAQCSSAADGLSLGKSR